MGWEVQPEGLTRLLAGSTRSTTPPPMYVTENGAAYDDARRSTAGSHDPERLAYLDAHLRAVHAALEAGVDVRGYFYWSLLDNFEWA